MSLYKLTFYISNWEQSKSQITKIHKKVFMDEHNLPLNFLRHRGDEERNHVFASNDITGQVVGVGCIHKGGNIGRIAILKDWCETNSIAHVIVDYLMHIAKTLKMDRIWLNAPIDSLDFFSYRDFYPMGTPFEFCNVRMQKLELWREAEEKNKILKSLHQ